MAAIAFARKAIEARTRLSLFKIRTNEGIMMKTNLASPIKVLELPA